MDADVDRVGHRQRRAAVSELAEVVGAPHPETAEIVDRAAECDAASAVVSNSYMSPTVVLLFSDFCCPIITRR